MSVSSRGKIQDSLWSKLLLIVFLTALVINVEITSLELVQSRQIENTNTFNARRFHMKNQNLLNTSKILSVQATDHDPISIDGNTDFHAQAITENWSGNGTPQSPYIINNLNIVGPVDTPFEPAPLKIQNTDLYFQISNCFLTQGYYGIRLDNVANGCLINNTATNNEFGFSVGGHNNTLINNTATNNKNRGFIILGNDNILSYNTATNNFCGFGMSGNNNTLSYNTATNNIRQQQGSTIKGRGFNLEGDFHTLSHNCALNNEGKGFNLLPMSSNNTLINNTATNNGGEGFYLDRQTLGHGRYNTLINNTATNNGEEGFYLDNSGLNILEHNTASNSGKEGFYLLGSDNNVLRHNTAADNSRSGFRLRLSHSNTLSYNSATNNDEDGFELVASNENILINNTATTNGGHDFFLGDDCNKNTLIDNTGGIYDSKNTSWSVIMVILAVWFMGISKRYSIKKKRD